MKLSFYTNLNPIGTELSASLISGNYHNFRMAVAYAKNSGVGRLYNDITQFDSHGGKTEAIIGIDQSITSYQALVNLDVLTKSNLHIHNDKGSITFHPKIYLLGNDKLEKVFIGSSNLTGGGLFSNFEANVGIDLDNSKDADDFRQNIEDYWQFLITDSNTKIADTAFIDELLLKGSISDENKTKSFRTIIGNLTGLPFTTRASPALPPIATQSKLNTPQFRDKFGMILSNFDVSPKSQDPIQLIPITALSANPQFWEFPTSYTLSGGDYPETYVRADVFINGQVFNNQIIRIYYYERKHEFRFQCEAIKRNGNAGDIMLIEKHLTQSSQYRVTLIPNGSSTFNQTLPLLTTKVSETKFFGYF